MQYFVWNHLKKILSTDTLLKMNKNGLTDRPINTEYHWVLDWWLLMFSASEHFDSLTLNLCGYPSVQHRSKPFGMICLVNQFVKWNSGSVFGEQVCCFRVVFKWVCLRQLFLMARVPFDPWASGFVWLEREHDGPNWLIPLVESGLGCGHASSKQKPRRSRTGAATRASTRVIERACVYTVYTKPEGTVRIHQQEVEEIPPAPLPRNVYM